MSETNGGTLPSPLNMWRDLVSHSGSELERIIDGDGKWSRYINDSLVADAKTVMESLVRADKFVGNSDDAALAAMFGFTAGRKYDGLAAKLEMFPLAARGLRDKLKKSESGTTSASNRRHKKETRNRKIKAEFRKLLDKGYGPKAAKISLTHLFRCKMRTVELAIKSV